MEDLLSVSTTILRLFVWDYPGERE